MPAPRLHVAADLLGHRFRFGVFPGLFCADRVDEGTRLLLAHLPPSRPSRVLDLGCGYGALGLPIAAAHPDCEFLLVDRDLLAVEASAANSVAHGLRNVVAAGSLGYRDTPGHFDWVICNVPARIGEAGVRYMVGAGAARLTPGGELRVVVIRDLGPVVERTCPAAKLVEAGPRHLVYAHPPADWDDPDHEAVYGRDTVQVGALGAFERPNDVNEDRAHLAEAMPLLLEVLPRQAPPSVLTWRLGYGVAARALARPGTVVTAADRDLLALTYARRNIREIKTLGASRLALVEGRYPLVALELYANVGPDLAREELAAAARLTARGGSAYVLVLSKVAREWLPGAPVKAARVASRGAWDVWRVAPA